LHSAFVGVPTAQTWGDGELAIDPSDSWPGSVSSATGSFFTSATDVQMPGIQLPFQLTRSYNSADTRSGAFGRGWTFNYGSQALIQDNGDIIVRGGDGQQLLYTKNPDGSFTSAPGGRATLATVTGGGYELVTVEQ